MAKQTISFFQGTRGRSDAFSFEKGTINTINAFEPQEDVLDLKGATGYTYNVKQNGMDYLVIFQGKQPSNISATELFAEGALFVEGVTFAQLSAANINGTLINATDETQKLTGTATGTPVTAMVTTDENAVGLLLGTSGADSFALTPGTVNIVNGFDPTQDKITASGNVYYSLVQTNAYSGTVLAGKNLPTTATAQEIRAAGALLLTEVTPEQLTALNISGGNLITNDDNATIVPPLGVDSGSTMEASTQITGALTNSETKERTTAAPSAATTNTNTITDISTIFGSNSKDIAMLNGNSESGNKTTPFINLRDGDDTLIVSGIPSGTFMLGDGNDNFSIEGAGGILNIMAGGAGRKTGLISGAGDVNVLAKDYEISVASDFSGKLMVSSWNANDKLSFNNADTTIKYVNLQNGLIRADIEFIATGGDVSVVLQSAQKADFEAAILTS